MESYISGNTGIGVSTEESEGQITVNVGHGDYAGPAWLDVTEARELAAALLRAADEVESRS